MEFWIRGVFKKSQKTKIVFQDCRNIPGSTYDISSINPWSRMSANPFCIQKHQIVLKKKYIYIAFTFK